MYSPLPCIWCMQSGRGRGALLKSNLSSFHMAASCSPGEDWNPLVLTYGRTLYASENVLSNPQEITQSPKSQYSPEYVQMSDTTFWHSLQYLCGRTQHSKIVKWCATSVLRHHRNGLVRESVSVHHECAVPAGRQPSRSPARLEVTSLRRHVICKSGAYLTHRAARSPTGL